MMAINVTIDIANAISSRIDRIPKMVALALIDFMIIFSFLQL